MHSDDFAFHPASANTNYPCLNEKDRLIRTGYFRAFGGGTYHGHGDCKISKAASVKLEE
jgi:hypothetical protein